ncbi:putative bacteriophage protein [Burkholderia sp. 8Y]|uniref:DUF2213 domain-containing protein n=1 Tax=Burkholderia sp. 8Y TaxID=2653133 RepID=UPI0012F16FD0|nr:DUF2213 domain-containing protein [Burkholderia sp. 8Y]VXB24733.1 putative bacteriophage protein [Burkholderia sp. 8Y]
MRFYTIQKLGPKRSLTPEGFLLCEEVPVARTGEMLYGAGEVPVEPGPDGLIRISRTPEEVFRDETLASCIGKPVTLDHPTDFVDPSNFGALSRGTMFNVRRGAGIADDLIIADLLVTEAEAIRAVQEDGIEEVSLGYEADYEQVSPGRGVQRNIVVNHVALVERGRCGPRCAIGDKEPQMAKKPSFLDKLRALMKDAEMEEKEEKKTDDEESEEQEEKKEKTGDSALLKSLVKRMEAQDALLASLATLVKAQAKDADGDDEEDEEDDESGKTGDEGDLTEAETGGKLNQAEVDLYTGDSAKTILSRAEILSPGIKLPTLDSKASTVDRAAALCKCQRKALDLAYQTDAGRAAIAPFVGGKTADFEKMPVALVNAAFMGASELMKAQNNGGAHASAAPTKDFGKRSTVADINKRNREFWADRAAH